MNGPSQNHSSRHGSLTLRSAWETWLPPSKISTPASSCTASIAERQRVSNRPPVLSIPLLFGLFLLTTATGANAAESCPTEGRAALLQDHPEQLLPCEKAEAATDRVWAAHARAQLAQFESAAKLYGELAKAETTPAARTALLVTAAYNDLRAGRPTDGLQRLAKENPQRRWSRAALASARAELLFAAKEYAKAERAVDEALKLDGASTDVLRQLLVRIAAAQGDREAFQAALKRMMLDSPASALSATAVKLATPPLEVPTLTTSELATRWDRWTTRGGAQQVADECRPKLESLPKDAAGARARFECGMALSTIKHASAERVLREVLSESSLRPKALLAIARIQGRGNNAKLVNETCAQIGNENKHEAAECAFLGAFIAQQQGQRAEARKGFETVTRTFPRHNRARDAAWFLAFDAYQHERESAVERFNELLKLSSGEDRAQVIYWRGRARAEKDPAAAKEDWNAVLRMDPFGYYGWLASLRLEEALAPAPSDQCGTSPAASLTNPPAAARDAARLLELGFARYAAQELSESVPKKSRDALSWRSFLEHANQYERIVLIGMANGGHGGPWPFSEDRRSIVEAAFPRAFPSALAKAVPVDRCLLLSLMRRESRFDPNATSAAQARGLLQLLPVTAEKVAKDFGQEAPTIDHLYDPETNVRLASQYVKKLYDRFGHPLLVAAAYNGGPNAVAKWTVDMAGVDFDEFVERIPFRETRHYVKAVGGAYAAYSLIYGGKRPTLSLEPVKAAPVTGVSY